MSKNEQALRDELKSKDDFFSDMVDELDSEGLLLLIKICHHIDSK